MYTSMQTHLIRFLASRNSSLLPCLHHLCYHSAFTASRNTFRSLSIVPTERSSGQLAVSVNLSNTPWAYRMPRCWLFAYHEKKCNVIAAPSPASSSIATSSGSNSGTSSGASSRCPSSSAQSSSSGSSSSVSTTVTGPGRRSFVDKHSNTQIMANVLLSIMDAEDSAELRSCEDAHLARALSDGPLPSARQGVNSPTGWGRQSSSASSKLNGPRESAWHEPPCEPACDEMFLEPIAVSRGRHSSASKHSSGRHYSPVLRGRASVDGFLTSRSPGPSRQFGNMIDLSRIEISKLRL